MNPRHSVPGWVRRLLKGAVSPDELETTVGDFEEAASGFRSRLAAHGWMAWQALTIRAWVAMDRWTERAGDGAGLFGWINGLKEMTRMGALLGDVRYGLRRMLRSPGFTAIAIASLALGIGANTAIFSLVNAVLLTEKPYTETEELLELYTASSDVPYGVFSYPDFVDVRDATGDIFEEVSASRFTFVQTDVDGGVEVKPAQLVSGNYFSLAGVRAHVGRIFGPEDDHTPGAHPVVLISYAYWERAFGADPGAVGSDLRLNGRPYQIVGVLQPEYTGDVRGMAPEVYAPIMMVGDLNPTTVDELQARGWNSIFLRARMRDGVTMPQVNAALDRLSTDMQRDYPDDWEAGRHLIHVATDDVVMFPAIDRMLVPALGLLMGVVGLVLLIACANLASFLLARATDRRKEIAVRLALGARRVVLVRQLLAETMLLAVAGGGAGIMLAYAGLNALLSADLPLPIPITVDVSPDSAVLLYTVGISVVAGLLFGLAPAVQATNPDVAPTLKDESTGGGRPKRITLRGALVAGQVAASLVLLVGAGLFLRSLRASQAVDPGFGSMDAAMLSITTPTDRYDSSAEAQQFVMSLIEDMEALPGVTSVGLIDRMQLDPLNSQSIGFLIDGVELPPDRTSLIAPRAAVTPGFFEAAGMRLVAGRNFDSSDDSNGDPVVVVNQAFVERYWPGEEGVGRIIRSSSGDTEYTIVGVVNTSKVNSLSEAPTPQVFRPYLQAFASAVTLTASTTGDDAALVRTLFETGRAADPELIVYEMRTMDRLLDMRLLPARLSAILAIAFAILASALACIGLYGVVSYAVASKSREVGIRMSLGADRGAVVGMLVKQGLGMVVVGGVIGLVLAGLTSGLASQFLYGVKPLDPLAFGGAAGLLAVVSLLAAWIPARRASRVNPVRALRSD